MIRQMLFTKYDVSYFNECKRSIGVRVGEHRRGSKKPLKDTPFLNHIFNTNHSFDFDGARILDIEPHYYRRITSDLVNIHAPRIRRAGRSIVFLSFCCSVICMRKLGNMNT